MPSPATQNGNKTVTNDPRRRVVGTPATLIDADLTASIAAGGGGTDFDTSGSVISPDWSPKTLLEGVDCVTGRDFDSSGTRSVVCVTG
jgi:hypothetical protein